MEINLENIFSPKSVAVVGASNNLKKVGGRTFLFLRKSNFKGRIFPINPNYGTIQGQICYPKLSSIKEVPEQIIICVPVQHVFPILEEAANLGVKSTIIFSGGFAEADEEGTILQQKIKNLIQSKKLTILGPNCMGIIYRNDFIATYASILEENDIVDSSTAFIGQSGAIGAYSFILSRQKDLNISTIISTGNEVMVEVGDCLSYLAEDPKIKIIMLYLEGCKYGKRLQTALKKARQRNKIILACKVGKTSEGERAASSHTANMVGDDTLFNELFEKYEVIRCDDIIEMINTANLLEKGIEVKGKNVGIMSISGGMGVIATDKCINYGLKVPLFTEETSREVKNHVSFAGSENPLDPTAQGINDLELFENLIKILLKDRNIDVALFDFAYLLYSEDRGKKFVQKVIAAARDSRIPIIVTGIIRQELKELLQENNIPFFTDLDRAIKTISLLEKSYRYLNNPNASFSEETKSLEVNYNLERKLIKAPQNSLLNEFDSKQLLSSLHLPLLESKIGKSEEEVVEIANLIGLPVALKVVDSTLYHKSDVGGVLLNLNTLEDVRNGYKKIMQNISKTYNILEIEGMLVEKMSSNILAEMLVTVKEDPAFGTSIIIGIGGVYTEILNDFVILLPPFSKEYILSSLKKLKGFRLLEGYRNTETPDLSSFISLIENLGAIFRDNTKINELELNPVALFPDGNGVVILDALIRLNK